MSLTNQDNLVRLELGQEEMKPDLPLEIQSSFNVRIFGIITDLIKEGCMSWKRFNSDQIIGLSREADVKVSRGKKVGQVL